MLSAICELSLGIFCDSTNLELIYKMDNLKISPPFRLLVSYLSKYIGFTHWSKGLLPTRGWFGGEMLWRTLGTKSVVTTLSE